MLKIILFTILWTQLGHTFTCPNIRLDKDFPGNTPKNTAKIKSMVHVPVQHQKLGICYSYTATQLFDAHRHTLQELHGQTVDKKISSPVFTAIMSKESWDKEGLTYKEDGSPHFPFEGGLTCDAYNRLKMIGSCSKEDLDSFLTKKGLDEETFFKKLIKIEEDISAEYFSKKLEVDKILERPSVDADQTYNQTYQLKKNVYDVSLLQLQIETQACQLNSIDKIHAELKDVFGDMFKINLEMFRKYFSLEMLDKPFQLNMIFDSVCPASERLRNNSFSFCKTYDNTEARKTKKTYPFTEKIIEKLKSNSLPVGISYCSKVLKKGEAYKGLTNKKTGTLSYADDCGSHASLVIGSRWNPDRKSCELLVRNSWGTSCTSYQPHYPSTKKSSQFDVKCEGGNIWVDYKALENNTFRLEHL